jgi:hypothetical protein
MWPEYFKSLFVAYLLGTFRGLKFVREITVNWRKLLVIFRFLMGISSVVSLRGPALSSTANLVDFLETSGVLDSPIGLIRRIV